MVRSSPAGSMSDDSRIDLIEDAIDVREVLVVPSTCDDDPIAAIAAGAHPVDIGC